MQQEGPSIPGGLSEVPRGKGRPAGLGEDPGGLAGICLHLQFNKLPEMGQTAWSLLGSI